MTTPLRVALAQISLTVGDTGGNAASVERAIAQARDDGRAHLVVFPELTLSGYPPEDLLLRPAFVSAVDATVSRVGQCARGIDVIVGHPWQHQNRLYNAVSWFRDGGLLARYCKRVLPNYGVFDERRYFQEGAVPCVQAVRGVRVGVVICEDAWVPQPVQETVAAGAELIVVANASPFHVGKVAERRTAIGARARENQVPVLYVNLVGGQDELVFDGGSFAVAPDGAIAVQGRFFGEDLVVVEWAAGLRSGIDRGLPEDDILVYRALLLGLSDYVGKNGFPGVLVGLSGGIDSAVTLALAVDAIGAERVRAVMMPSVHTSPLSLELAAAQSAQLKVAYEVLPIDGAVAALAAATAQALHHLPVGVVAENLQARVRGTLLMALSNATGALVLTTGNKSEMAVGYATLYGDMAGGFALLKDLTKTWVYRIAAVMNDRATREGRGPAVPAGVISRAPTAELAPGQLDADSLPPYDQLDRLIEAYIEDNQDVVEASRMSGLKLSTATALVQRIRASEYKRRQAPPGVRTTRRGFGRDWRYPVTSLDREAGKTTTEDSHEEN